MSGDGRSVVAGISSVLDVEAGLAGDLMARHAPEELGTFAREHWPNDHLEGASKRRLVVLAHSNAFGDARARVVQHIFNRGKGNLGLKGEGRKSVTNSEL